jgi:hypothetical protein
MLLGGLWHGAAWTFVIWGGLHGLYLMVNHGWETLRSPSLGLPGRLAAGAVTFVAVVIGWVFFRAPDVRTAWHILQAMAGMNGAAIPAALLDHAGVLGSWLRHLGITSAAAQGGTEFASMWLWVLGLLALAWLSPNTQQIMVRAKPTLVSPQRQCRSDQYPPPASSRAPSNSMRQPSRSSQSTATPSGDGGQ